MLFEDHYVHWVRQKKIKRLDRILPKTFRIFHDHYYYVSNVLKPLRGIGKLSSTYSTQFFVMNSRIASGWVYHLFWSFFLDLKEEERVSLSVRPSYEHPETGHSPVYYRSQCSVSVPAQDLGEGTHSFQGYIYPDVPGGESLVTALTPDRNVTFSEYSVLESTIVRVAVLSENRLLFYLPLFFFCFWVLFLVLLLRSWELQLRCMERFV